MSEAATDLRSALSAAIMAVVENVVREEIQAAIQAALPKTTGQSQRPELLKVEQVADELQVKRTTVRGWIRSGALKATLLGPAGKRREYRVRRTDLDAFVSGESQVDAPDIDSQLSRVMELDARRRR